MTLVLDHIGLTRANGRRVLDGVSARIGAGEFVGLIGPNGAGKTTLLRAALGLLAAEGESSLAVLPPRARAREVAFLPQAREIAWDLNVETLVALGRNPHLAPGQRIGAPDRAAVAQALGEMRLEGFASRRATRLSGGERARALIARALAQDTPLLLADEPIAGLDPAAQIATMELFARLAREGRGVVAALHDLSLAARHCTRLIVLHEGRKVADGTPMEVLTPELLAQVFHISGTFTPTESGPIFQPLGLV